MNKKFNGIYKKIITIYNSVKDAAPGFKTLN